MHKLICVSPTKEDARDDKPEGNGIKRTTISPIDTATGIEDII